MSTLDLTAIGLQGLLPLALIGWLAVAPLPSKLGFLLQVLATGVAVLALLLAGVWMVPPWWAPWLYLVLWLMAALARSPGRSRMEFWRPRGLRAWTAVAGLTALSIWAGSVVASALSGRIPPADVRVVDLALPLGPGRYLVVHGGASETINGHFLTLHPTTDRQRAYRGQSYAVDLIAIRDSGLRASGWRPTEPAAYAIFGEPVFAPCQGTVIAAVGGMPDMPVPTTDTSRLEGNHVVIRCGDFAVLLAHLHQGSVLVAAGDELAVGQQMGQVGNSGQSNEPHLHIHVQAVPESGSLFSGAPYFLTFDGDFPVRNDRLTIAVTPYEPEDAGL